MNGHSATTICRLSYLIKNNILIEWKTLLKMIHINSYRGTLPNKNFYKLNQFIYLVLYYLSLHIPTFSLPLLTGEGFMLFQKFINPIYLLVAWYTTSYRVAKYPTTIFSAFLSANLQTAKNSINFSIMIKNLFPSKFTVISFDVK